MRFTRFGVTLERLGARDLELVRYWRNSDTVRPHMRYQRIISPEDQKVWFSGLNCLNDWYFTGKANAEPFGLFHIKNIDWTSRCGEAGGFAGYPELLGCPEPARAVLALMDFAFLVLQLDALEAQYKVNLSRIVMFNEQLGYERVHQDREGFVRARVLAEGYFDKAALVRKAASQLYGPGALLANTGAMPLKYAGERPQRCRDDFQLQIE